MIVREAYPPPILCREVPCFQWISAGGSRQNLLSKGVVCRFLCGKELRAAFGQAGSEFRIGGAAVRSGVWISYFHCARKWGNLMQIEMGWPLAELCAGQSPNE